MRLLTLAPPGSLPAGGGAHALLDVRYDPTHRTFSSFSRCDLYTRPEDARDPANQTHLPDGWSVTCGLKLLHIAHATGHAARPRHGSSRGVSRLLAQAVDCDGKPTTHGRDYLYVELARPGEACAVRLPAAHVGGGMYSFSGWSWVSSGPWNATFRLFASATPRLWEPGPAANMTSVLFDSDWQYAIRKFFRNTAKLVGVHHLNKAKTLQPLDTDPWVTGTATQQRDRTHLPQCSYPMKGEWLQVPPSPSGACPPELCTGDTSALYYSETINVQRGFRHVYAPWGCKYRLYSRNEARACLASKRVLLIGDSRMSHLNNSFFELLELQRIADHAGIISRAAAAGPEHAVTYLKYVRFKPERIGIRAVLADWAGFEAALTQYDVILVGSSDHDVADYNQAMPFENPFHLEVHPCQAEEQAGNASSDACSHFSRFGLPLEDPGDECYPPGGNFTTIKYRPYGQYLEAVAGFASRLNTTRARLLKAAAGGHDGQAGGAAAAAARRRSRRLAQVFWLFTGNKPYPRYPKGFCYADQLDRILCMHAEALSRLQHSGVVPVDLATMQMDAPYHWWDDNVHVGKFTPRNGLAAMSIQVLLNTMCSMAGG